MTPPTHSLEVRRAWADDAEALARLAGELGYPSTPAQVRERIASLQKDAALAVFVAVVPGGQIVGWIQLTEVRSLTTGPRAEINGLVVDSGYRGMGVGQLLLDRGESWARQMGLATMGLHSNVIRERAHQFYERSGYRVVKSQKVFRKKLS